MLKKKFAVVAMGAALAVGLLAGCTNSSNDPTPVNPTAVPTVVKKASVEFKLTGSEDTATFVSVSASGAAAPDIVNNVKLPYTKTVDAKNFVSNSATMLSQSVKGSKNLTCEIIVNGKTVAKQTVNGQFKSLICSITPTVEGNSSNTKTYPPGFVPTDAPTPTATGTPVK
jgi:hypothetical protein